MVEKSGLKYSLSGPLEKVFQLLIQTLDTRVLAGSGQAAQRRPYQSSDTRDKQELTKRGREVRGVQGEETPFAKRKR